MSVFSQRMATRLKRLSLPIERGIEAPAYGPRCAGRPSKLASYLDFLRERVTAFPDLSAARLTREIRELGYVGAYTAVKRYLAAIRPQNAPKPYEVRFETPPGVQAQVDFAMLVSVAAARRISASGRCSSMARTGRSMIARSCSRLRGHM